MTMNDPTDARLGGEGRLPFAGVVVMAASIMCFFDALDVVAGREVTL